jgi:hypothetical protein
LESAQVSAHNAAAGAILATALLSGCFGIAHVNVLVPKLELEIAQTASAQAEAFPVDIVRPGFGSESQTFLAIVKQSVTRSDLAYEVRSIDAAAGSPVQVTFPEEKRYVGVPVAIVPMNPSRESTESRVFFLSRGGENEVLRIRIVGEEVRIEEANLLEARSDMPSVLLGQRPGPLSDDWKKRIEAEVEFYQSIRWKNSGRLRVSMLRRQLDQDLVALELQR